MYVKSFEGFRSSLVKAGMVGALSLSPIDVKSTDSSMVKVSEVDGLVVDFNKILKIKSEISEISQVRKNHCKDSTLNSILNDIEMSISSDSSEKYADLFNRLSTHLEEKYLFKIEDRDISKVDTSEIENMSLVLILGWLGSLCLSICGLPQAWMSFKEKNSQGISWGFLLLWGFGELFGIAYVLDKMDAPLVMNYATNILIVGVILYYKINPKKE